MWRFAAVLACSTLSGCQIDGPLYEERFEPPCEAGAATRPCLCDDDRFGVAECLGEGDSGPCDCDGTPPGDGVEAIAMGGLHTCALLGDGRVSCWGDNDQGQLGDGSRRASSQPVEALVQGDIASLALGGNDIEGHGCALFTGGGLRCWGDNDRGQLGDGSRERRLTAVEVELPPLSQVAAGANHTCAVTRDGEGLCWGDNDHLQLGRDTPGDPWSVTPAPVDGDPALSAMGLGRHHSCAIDREGQVWCWGEGEPGQLGDGDTRDRKEAVLVEGLSGVTQLALGAQHTCALDGEQRVHCWGRNHRGQLGDETVQDRPTPVAVEDLPGSTAIAAGWLHTCALDGGGTVRCWGDNDEGQLGDGSDQGSAFAVEVEGLEGVTAIAAALHSTCARLDDGSAKCWGDNGAGQLGDGTHRDRPRPVSVRWVGSPLLASDAGQM